MPATIIPEIEPAPDETTTGNGGRPPVANSSNGGDDDANRDGHRDDQNFQASPRRHSTAVAVALISTSVFFMAMVGAFVLLRFSVEHWVGFHIPPILWINTAILLASSGTLELARRKLARGDDARFARLWYATMALGVLFLGGQLLAWKRLQAQGVYMASNQASSFFYIFTGAHAVHLAGGLMALLYVAIFNFQGARLSRAAAAQVTSYYWHFMDALWVFLLGTMFVAK